MSAWALVFALAIRSLSAVTMILVSLAGIARGELVYAVGIFLGTLAMPTGIEWTVREEKP